MNVHRDGRGTDVAGPIRHNWPTGPFYNLTIDCQIDRQLVSVSQSVSTFPSVFLSR